VEYEYFDIENFRGIQRLRIDLQASPKSRVFALVGLNESGKTTILEAINHFAYKIETLDPLQIPGYAIKDLHSLIPISQRANFNGHIKCRIGIRLDNRDVGELQRFLVRERKFRSAVIGNELQIEHSLAFKDSIYVKERSQVLWTWTKQGTRAGKRTKQNITGDDWVELVKRAKALIPSILYFPTFVFEFPDKIYLEDGETKDERSRFYRLVLQDVLDATGTGTNLETHVLKRSKSKDLGDRKNLDSILLEMGRNVTKTVFTAWNKIFKTSVSPRNVRFTIAEDGGRAFIQLQLEDADGFYLLNERSLGFRWFFIFLLLTHYRGFRQGGSQNVLFLFDEPASNLHASAQAQLLESFQTISQKCMILYTTHSHHMIDVRGLDATYVVKNAGISYEGSDERFSAGHTDVVATKYRSFAATHPDQTNYYKPVLDVLDYQPSSLELVPEVLMVEGKTDFYLIKYFAEVVLPDHKRIHVLPGTGSGNLGQSIRLYLGWGRRFMVLLDDDSEGRAQKERYGSDFGFACELSTFTLGMIDKDWKGMSIEGLVSDEDRVLIQQTAYPEATKYKKTHFHRAVQEALMLRKVVPVSSATRDTFEKLLTAIWHHLGQVNVA
jgi:AAA15 family ATPase/GTPase